MKLPINASASLTVSEEIPFLARPFDSQLAKCDELLGVCCEPGLLGLTYTLDPGR